MIRIALFLLLIVSTVSTVLSQSKPVKIAIAGMTHGHVGWILNRADRGDIEVVGFSEPNEELAKRLLSEHGFDESLWYPDLEALLNEKEPVAVCAFGSIFEHLAVVETCAPKGIHVMVEKPLAVNMDHANRMKELADANDIFLLTNYETNWYNSNYEIQKRSLEGKIGDIRKIVVHDGHSGPIEIGCSPEFLSWLTDPVQNGGGAIIDFGCYGANLSTWLMNNQRPVSLTAVTQQIKPHMYPNVDDEATIVLEYEGAQAIIQASWNWTFNRKDIEVYGVSGALFAPNGTTLISKGTNGKEVKEQLEKMKDPYDDPFAYLAAVVVGEIDPGEGLYSLQNNMIVVEILSKAIESAKTGKRIYFE